MKHVKGFESFLNEAVAKFNGKEVYPEGYDQRNFGAPVKSPNELIQGNDYILLDNESNVWLGEIRYRGNNRGRYEFIGPDQFDDTQDWYFNEKEMNDLIKLGHLYKEK